MPCIVHKKLPKTLLPDKSCLPKANAQAKIDPEKFNAYASTSVTTGWPHFWETKFPEQLERKIWWNAFLLAIMSQNFIFPEFSRFFPTKIQISLSFPKDFHSFSNSLSFPDLWPRWTTFSGSLPLIKFILFPWLSNNLTTAFITDENINIQVWFKTLCTELKNRCCFFTMNWILIVQV